MNDLNGDYGEEQYDYPYGCPFQCGDARTMRKWYEKAEEARRVQPTRFHVAPQVTLKLAGRVVTAGEPVNDSDFGGADFGGIGRLLEAVKTGHVLDKTL